jgi:hypothetical protein
MHDEPNVGLAAVPAKPGEGEEQVACALIHFSHVSSGGLTTWSMDLAPDYVPNYGDILVCRAILNQVDVGPFVQLNFGEEADRKVERGLIRGSTYLHNEFDFDAAIRTIDSVDGPITIVGLGAQNPVLDLTFLDGNAGARAFVARLNERSASISVRGDFSAAIVERLGGKNIRITGCPTLFTSGRTPEVAIRGLLAHPKRRLGISIHSDLYDNLYCRSAQHAMGMHGPVIDFALRNSSQALLFEQGVLSEYSVADHTLPLEERLDHARTLFAKIGHPGFDAVDLVAHMVSVESIEEWMAKVRDLDAMIGFRFHGNVIGLLQSLPCYYYVYDSRLNEFCDLYRLPHQEVETDFVDPVRAMLDHDWTLTNARLRACRAELDAFYLENGLPITDSMAAGMSRP